MSLVLNKKLNELAKASVSKLSAHLEMFGMNESFLFNFPYCKSKKTNCAYSDFILLLSIHQNVYCCYILSGISDGDMALQGALGSLSLSDLTPHGDLYRERFTTQGGEALIFNILKYVSLQCSKDCSSVLKELEVSCCF